MRLPVLKYTDELDTQEVGGMNSTLDETLGDSNPHYSRVLREKIAVREAAYRAMETRKAAMVEASWCRILQAASIQSKDAEAQLLEAEKDAAEAFEAATAIGVIMYDIPDCPRKHYEIEETSAVNGGTHTITASFETAFEVDKQVATAVKTAFLKLGSCHSINEDEFKELLQKIRQNPDTGENKQELSEHSSECESDTGSELEDPNYELAVAEGRERKYNKKKKKKKQISKKLDMAKLVDMMVERLKSLQEVELASLVTIVATCGLNAALEEAENCKKKPSFGAATRRNFYMDGQMRRKQVEAELPSLDKFLVKHLTKLEREVQEAKNARMNEGKEGNGEKPDRSDDETDGPVNNITSAETIPDLDSSKIEKDTKLGKSDEIRGEKPERRHTKHDIEDLPSLDKFFVRHVSKLEREVQEAKNKGKFEPTWGKGTTSSFSDKDQVGKENINLNKQWEGGEPALEQKEASDALLLQHGADENKENEKENSLDKNLVKPVHRLEREKMQALSKGSNYKTQLYQKKDGGTMVVDYESLDKVLVKHVSRLEKEKMALGIKEEVVKVNRRRGEPNMPLERSEGSLDQILVKHKSRLEKEKMVAAASQPPDDQIKHSVARREARERELREAWGGLSLGNSIRPHVSKIERDKAAWLKAEEEERKRAMEEEV
ncbi:hypothetical protein U1Q18_004047 [Sarracenia purpurea var. burkii]